MKLGFHTPPTNMSAFMKKNVFENDTLFIYFQYVKHNIKMCT